MKHIRERCTPRVERCRHTFVVEAGQSLNPGGWGLSEETMSYPTIEIGKKRIILLSGFEKRRGADKPLAVKAKRELQEAAKKHRDAVAFGYVSGMWLPAA